MKIDGKSFRSIWLADDGWSVHIFDQTRLPHEIVVLRLTTVGAVAHAIKSMQTRGAPLIGACAAYGLALALHDDPSDGSLARNYETLLATRPTAINLRWALDAMRATLQPLAPGARAAAAYAKAQAICDEDVAI
ncbi:MAG: S-methyl-5-thioribose-1-phosphate isomerase, partial [Alphaproteobacteria bacterium]|nr:S-methyl-5-thioribose-1-phosphate isomerase [Alphaproteobacteria bacterium]